MFRLENLSVSVELFRKAKAHLPVCILGDFELHCSINRNAVVNVN